MLAPARRAAYRALRAVASGSHDLPSACALEDGGLRDPRDRALMREIVTGTLRWRRRLDHLIEAFAKRTVERIDPEVRTILELSAHQLLHLDRVPAAAVVDDAVTLTKMVRKTSAAGFVNAVLRGITRRRTNLPLPPRPAPDASVADQVAYLGITLSHPDWLVARWLDRLGFEDTERWLLFNNEIPPACLRVNPLRGPRDGCLAALRAAGVSATPARWAPGAFFVESGDPQPVTAAGLAFIQDEASQLVASLVQAGPGARVLDTCAAPGGKTTAIAARMEDDGLIVACDVRPRRMRLLGDTVRLSAASAIRLVQIGATGPLPVAPIFDWVLVDAPCSGLGTLRRDPDAKWARTAADLPALVAAQGALLARAAEVVRPGGRLVYATCSSEPEENDGVVRSFLDAHPEFTLIDLSQALPAGMPPEVIDRGGVLRTSPHRHGLEAFYGAVLARR
ncbi:MAG: 16S rRNA (cytosine(967)-C(5))-methyltransferase RsmB [Vicinamibacterales bacterium]|nr:16S rRNA (cytosine(967)-C(5))-methyltransferase RsmB [Vicinamibacterales bacterium]